MFEIKGYLPFHVHVLYLSLMFYFRRETYHFDSRFMHYFVSATIAFFGRNQANAENAVKLGLF